MPIFFSKAYVPPYLITPPYGALHYSQTLHKIINKFFFSSLTENWLLLKASGSFILVWLAFNVCQNEIALQKQWSFFVVGQFLENFDHSEVVK